MAESILESVKEDIGAMTIPDEESPFDNTLIRYINTALSILNQIGVGEEGYKIEDASDTWDEFLTQEDNLEAVKSAVVKRVRLMFDPPQSSYVLESENRILSELEWRLNVMGDTT